MSPRKGGFRHLIYFIDGTWLWPGSDKSLDVYSNIYLMNTLLSADDAMGRAQVVHYSRGLGAVNGIRKYTAGGFAYGIDELVADLYVNICSNYEADDKLYIFGFSRGAVVARALAGLLSKGILEAQHVNMFAHVWGDFIGSDQVALPGAPVGTPPKQQIDQYSKKCSQVNPEIEFLGVFDTVVGGHGPSEVAQRLRLNERRVPDNVKNAVQILAVDESRNFFRPVMWTGIQNPTTHFEQIWLPGVHSDIGGAYTNRLIGNISLITMIDRVIARTALSFDLNECKAYNAPHQPHNLVRIHNEYTKLWRCFCPFPKPRGLGDFEQTIHPFTHWLNGQDVNYKGEEIRFTYTLPEDFCRLKVAKDSLSGQFQSFVPPATLATSTPQVTQAPATHTLP